MMFKFFNNIINCYTRQKKYFNLIEKIEKIERQIKDLEEENIENTNLIYELINSLAAIDNRIDIIAEEFGKCKDV